MNYSNFFAKILLISVIFFSFSCSLFVEPIHKSWKSGFKPRPLTGVRGFPSTDSEYGKGFKDGCHSAWDIISKGLLSDFNQKKYDFRRMQKSSDYNTGWWDGMEQCTYILDHDVL
jgi:hypothetical protein